MNLPTIKVTEEEATAKLAEYEEAIRRDRTAEDEAIAQAYRAAKRGLQVVRLSQAIAMGGYFDNHGLPRIAITRADAAQCYVYWSGDDLIYSDVDRWHTNFGALVGNHSVRVPMRNVAIPRVRAYRRSSAPVPLVPPRHRPKRYRLSRCHILWEVEQWAQVPARDPALLRHIRGDLWAVLAVWDLTELERAILSQRSV
jgi:hypothetical protein